ncbi:hypothetical protein FACS1894218_4460 [Bacilli bacterium]|nr:hypothetical protein FACS1894218_4460 [Bacilli bacterium]
MLVKKEGRNMQNKKHILSQNGKHHKKKILLLATLIPLGFLATGGAVIGGMAIAKVGPFADASKTDINTIFSVNDGTKDINTDVEPYISDGDTTKVHDYM